MGTTKPTELIRQALKSDDRDYAWLSRRSGVKYKQVLAEIKHEQRALPLDNAIRYAEALGLTVADLVQA